MDPPFKERHVYRIRSNNLRVGVFVPGVPEPYEAQFLGVREKGHPKSARLDTEFLGEGSFGTVRRVEEDFGIIPTALGEISTSNEVLFGYLYRLEESLGLGWDLLSILPRTELKRCKPETLDEHYKAREEE